MSHYVDISVREVKQRILNNKDALILDIRDAYSYKEGHIQGAMQAHDKLIAHLLRSKEKLRPLLVYCYHGNSSKDFAEMFGESGFAQAYSMIGGYTAWKKRHFLFSETAYAPQTNEWLEKECFEPQALNATIDGHLTPLMLACQQAKHEVVAELIAAGADLDAKDAEGNTALWFAICSNCDKTLDTLIEAGIQLDTRNGDGNTAIMLASAAGKEAAVRKLLRKGARLQADSEDSMAVSCS